MKNRELIKKVCLVGDSGVGKKTIASIVAPFEKGVERYTQTIGTAVTKYGLEFAFANQTIRLIIMVWDVTGRQEYRRLQRSYCMGAEGVIVVGDASEPSTIGSIHKWIDDVRATSGDIPAVVIINKTEGLQETARSELQSRLKEILDPYDAPFYLVDAASSSKTALKAPFYELAKRIAKKAAARPSPSLR
jgi:GTPase SAR1 family protein